MTVSTEQDDARTQYPRESPDESPATPAPPTGPALERSRRRCERAWRATADVRSSITASVLDALHIVPACSDRLCVEPDGTLHLVERREERSIVSSTLTLACGLTVKSGYYDDEGDVRPAARGAWQRSSSRCPGCAPHAHRFPAAAETPDVRARELEPWLERVAPLARFLYDRALQRDPMPHDPRWLAQVSSRWAVMFALAEDISTDDDLARIVLQGLRYGSVGEYEDWCAALARAGDSRRPEDLLTQDDWEEFIGREVVCVPVFRRGAVEPEECAERYWRLGLGIALDMHERLEELGAGEAAT